ncbi:MAG: tRNA-dihydrouridine synthase family protein [Phycisphaerales bacterium]|nr:MAG: tRNA-dihydrouridine synthase family protein [Phycisphaerales bacterium]
MSVDLSPSDVPPRKTSRPIEQIARQYVMDPRIGRIVPGFDAPFFQAGLAGYSDGAMRLVARRHGCPYAVTEALLDQTLISGGKGRTRENPDLLRPPAIAPTSTRGSTSPTVGGDHPIGGQIIGSTPHEMARSALIVLEMNYDVIDVNLACPVRKIRRRFRGGHLLEVPEEAVAILKAVREAVPAEVPTTVKLRRGTDDTPEAAANFQRIFDAAFDLDYAWATVHCRTVQQKYHGPSDWDFLTDLLRRHPDRLIFGSGDIWRVEDIFAMLDITGVKAVAAARGCIGNPWIFRQARQLMAGETPTHPTIADQRQALLEHFDLSMRLWGERAASRMMRKFGIKFSAHHPDAEAVKNEFIKCRSAAEWRDVLDRYYGQVTDSS